jgi:DNA topoisomerase-2
MSKNVEDKYKKYELLEHIQSLPDTYIGSTEITKIRTYIYNDETKKMFEKEISYIPGLLKIFDEVVVNAIDHSQRLKMETKKDVKPVKNIKVNINKETGIIKIFNDGNGIDIEKHKDYNNIWIPELIFGELLTSTNYDKTEEKTWGGKNGFGAKLTNIFSKEFIIETVDHYTKRLYTQTFTNNMTQRNKPTVKSSTKQPYTSITFLPDYERFGLENGMTDDIYDLFKRRIIDACATTNKEVSVWFNDEKLLIKDFEKYGELFIEDKTEQPLVYEVCNDRWEVVATLSKTGIHEQISFVNGINTIRGGRHVDYITQNIIKRLVDMAQSKKKKTIKSQHIKDNLKIFVKSIIVNPSFDSQSKETLTTQASKFGSKCELSDKFIEKLFKCGIIDKALSLTEFHDQKKLVKTDGKKTSKIIIPKLDDANLAGTKHSNECTLILTEGDSAKTMAISGLSVIGRDKYGVFPLRGKIMNVKDATLQKISDNAEITALKKILGLEQNKKYTDVSSLRYGSIMIMTDQDHDGSHIKGLLFNLFQSLWNSLYKIDGFLTSMLTPIIKASYKDEVISFYNMSDYENWLEKNSNKKNWKIKYYKGLGTSKDDEAKEYFKNMKKITYKYNEESDENLDLAFNKKRSDDRKTWLLNYNKNNVLDYTKLNVNYDTFINKEFIHYSNRDLERSINHICDGLKESTRKILFACIKRKLYNNEIKVAQLAGNVSEVTAYHHGENSLQQAIIGMAQIYVGTNNINILQPNGQFGSRIQGGNDSSSPRYIFTLLSNLTKLIFREEDTCILNYLNDDGISIEPEYYIPIIPMILVNGGIGIGTGFSTNVPLFNPDDIIKSCLDICNTITNKNINITNIDDMHLIYNIIDEISIKEYVPYYLGFNGSITKDSKNQYESRGIYNWLTDTTLEITELPIGTWTENYKEFLENIIQNNQFNLKSFESHYTAKNIKFILHFTPGARAIHNNIEKFENNFKLVSTKNLSINNMHLYTEKGAIKKYNNTSSILKEWSKIRLLKYFERKICQIKNLENDYNILSNKIRFILDVINGNIKIMNVKLDIISKRLNELNYSKIYKDSDNDIDDNDNSIIKGYNYLLKMPISQLTLDRKIILEKEVDDIKNILDKLKNTNIQDIWFNELNTLLSKWCEHKQFIENDYLNDKNSNKNKTNNTKKTKK